MVNVAGPNRLGERVHRLIKTGLNPRVRLQLRFARLILVVHDFHVARFQFLGHGFGSLSDLNIEYSGRVTSFLQSSLESANRLIPLCDPTLSINVPRPVFTYRYLHENIP